MSKKESSSRNAADDIGGRHRIPRPSVSLDDMQKWEKEFDERRRQLVEKLQQQSSRCDDSYTDPCADKQVQSDPRSRAKRIDINKIAVGKHTIFDFAKKLDKKDKQKETVRESEASTSSDGGSFKDRAELNELIGILSEHRAIQFETDKVCSSSLTSVATTSTTAALVVYSSNVGSDDMNKKASPQGETTSQKLSVLSQPCLSSNPAKWALTSSGTTTSSVDDECESTDAYPLSAGRNDLATESVDGTGHARNERNQPVMVVRPVKQESRNAATFGEPMSVGEPIAMMISPTGHNLSHNQASGQSVSSSSPTIPAPFVSRGFLSQPSCSLVSTVPLSAASVTAFSMSTLAITSHSSSIASAAAGIRPLRPFGVIPPPPPFMPPPPPRMLPMPPMPPHSMPAGLVAAAAAAAHHPRIPPIYPPVPPLMPPMPPHHMAPFLPPRLPPHPPIPPPMPPVHPMSGSPLFKPSCMSSPGASARPSTTPSVSIAVVAPLSSTLSPFISQSPNTIQSLPTHNSVQHGFVPPLAAGGVNVSFPPPVNHPQPSSMSGINFSQPPPNIRPPSSFDLTTPPPVIATAPSTVQRQNTPPPSVTQVPTVVNTFIAVSSASTVPSYPLTAQSLVTAAVTTTCQSRAAVTVSSVINASPGVLSSDEMTSKESASDTQFLVSCQLLFCSLCSHLSPDEDSAKLHLKSADHYIKYKRYLGNSQVSVTAAPAKSNLTDPIPSISSLTPLDIDGSPQLDSIKSPDSSQSGAGNGSGLSGPSTIRPQDLLEELLKRVQQKQKSSNPTQPTADANILPQLIAKYMGASSSTPAAASTFEKTNESTSSMENLRSMVNKNPEILMLLKQANEESDLSKKAKLLTSVRTLLKLDIPPPPPKLPKQRPVSVDPPKWRLITVDSAAIPPVLSIERGIPPRVLVDAPINIPLNSDDEEGEYIEPKLENSRLVEFGKFWFKAYKASSYSSIERYLVDFPVETLEQMISQWSSKGFTLKVESFENGTRWRGTLTAKPNVSFETMWQRSHVSLTRALVVRQLILAAVAGLKDPTPGFLESTDSGKDLDDEYEPGSSLQNLADPCPEDADWRWGNTTLEALARCADGEMGRDPSNFLTGLLQYFKNIFPEKFEYVVKSQEFDCCPSGLPKSQITLKFMEPNNTETAAKSVGDCSRLEVQSRWCESVLQATGDVLIKLVPPSVASLYKNVILEHKLDPLDSTDGPRDTSSRQKPSSRSMINHLVSYTGNQLRSGEFCMNKSFITQFSSHLTSDWGGDHGFAFKFTSSNGGNAPKEAPTEAGGLIECELIFGLLVSTDVVAIHGSGSSHKDALYEALLSILPSEMRQMIEHQAEKDNLISSLKEEELKSKAKAAEEYAAKYGSADSDAEDILNSVESEFLVDSPPSPIISVVKKLRKRQKASSQSPTPVSKKLSISKSASPVTVTPPPIVVNEEDATINESPTMVEQPTPSKKNSRFSAKPSQLTRVTTSYDDDIFSTHGADLPPVAKTPGNANQKPSFAQKELAQELEGLRSQGPPPPASLPPAVPVLPSMLHPPPPFIPSQISMGMNRGRATVMPPAPTAIETHIIPASALFSTLPPPNLCQGSTNNFVASLPNPEVNQLDPTYASYQTPAATSIYGSVVLPPSFGNAEPASAPGDVCCYDPATVTRSLDSSCANSAAAESEVEDVACEYDNSSEDDLVRRIMAAKEALAAMDVPESFRTETTRMNDGDKNDFGGFSSSEVQPVSITPIAMTLPKRLVTKPIPRPQKMLDIFEDPADDDEHEKNGGNKSNLPESSKRSSRSRSDKSSKERDCRRDFLSFASQQLKRGASKITAAHIANFHRCFRGNFSYTVEDIRETCCNRLKPHSKATLIFKSTSGGSKDFVGLGKDKEDALERAVYQIAKDAPDEQFSPEFKLKLAVKPFSGDVGEETELLPLDHFRTYIRLKLKTAKHSIHPVSVLEKFKRHMFDLRLKIAFKFRISKPNCEPAAASAPSCDEVNEKYCVALTFDSTELISRNRKSPKDNFTLPASPPLEFQGRGRTTTRAAHAAILCCLPEELSDSALEGIAGGWDRSAKERSRSRSRSAGSDDQERADSIDSLDKRSDSGRNYRKRRYRDSSSRSRSRSPVKRRSKSKKSRSSRRYSP